MSRKKRLPVLTGILVESFAAEGKCIARVDGKVIFIEGVVPGDRVDVQLIKSKKDWAEAFPVNFHEYSKDRLDPFCHHFGACGGCTWQMVPYHTQLEQKQQQVSDHLHRIGKLELPFISPIIGADKTVGYRNKLEYTFATRRFIPKAELQRLKRENPMATAEDLANMEGMAAGFHAKGMFDKVVQIDHCHLQEEPSNKLRNAIVAYALENKRTFYDIKLHKGWLRNLIVRTANSGEVMANIVFGEVDEYHQKKLFEMIEARFPEITTLLYTINTKFNDSLHGLEPQVQKGKGYIYEILEHFKFKVGPLSFFQTNTTQSEKLYQVARNFANLTGDEILYDLYCGTGSIGIFCSGGAKKVIGVEMVSEAIDDANENAGINGIVHAHFFVGDVVKVCNDSFFLENGRPDVIITDPPRAGMHDKLVEKLLQMEAPTIVYVSCNPATQARDLSLLSQKYSVTAIQPVDMFPHTQHIENVVQLKLNLPQ